VGVLSGVLGAYVNRSATIELSFKKPALFSQHLQSVMATMQFELRSQPQDSILLYQRVGRLGLNRECVYVEMTRHHAKLMSRSNVLKQIQQQLEGAQSVQET
jgi:hypothetical protein